MVLISDNMMDIQSIMDGKLSMDHAVILFIMNHIAGTTVEHENVQKVLGDPTQNFDLIIAEWMFSELYSR